MHIACRPALAFNAQRRTPIARRLPRNRTWRSGFRRAMMTRPIRAIHIRCADGTSTCLCSTFPVPAVDPGWAGDRRCADLRRISTSARRLSFQLDRALVHLRRRLRQRLAPGVLRRVVLPFARPKLGATSDGRRLCGQLGMRRLGSCHGLALDLRPFDHVGGIRTSAGAMVHVAIALADCYRARSFRHARRQRFEPRFPIPLREERRFLAGADEDLPGDPLETSERSFEPLPVLAR